MWKPVLLVANFVDAARRNLLSGKVEAHRHGSLLSAIPWGAGSLRNGVGWHL
jgi:hypothetical protein